MQEFFFLPPLGSRKHRNNTNNLRCPNRLGEMQSGGCGGGNIFNFQFKHLFKSFQLYSANTYRRGKRKGTDMEEKSENQRLLMTRQSHSNNTGSSHIRSLT